MKKSSDMQESESSSLASRSFLKEVVLIEQDEKLRRNLSELLNGYCKNLFSFESLRPAFLHLKQRNFPSVVVTDLYLPDGRSIDLIKSCVRKSEVIVISSLVSQEEAFLLGKMGVKSFFKKPVDIHRLNSVLEQSLDGKKIENKLAINTFGGLSILKNDCEIQFGRKSPYKILEFIACILSFGAKNVPVRKICDHLWPDADGDKAEKNFTTCLRRARDLLGSEDSDAIIRSSGKVSFNSEKVIVDFWCLDKSLCGSGGDEHKSYSEGHFYQDWLPEYDSPWVLNPREKYKNLAKISNL